MHSFDTLFLDRDGVINKKLDGKYVCDFSEFEFMPGALSAISKLSNLFSRIIIITNQQGISKGIMSTKDLTTLHTQMKKRIEDAGGRIDKIYYCPHLEEINCLCRKPKPGMIKQALINFPQIKIEKTYLIGDSDSDIEAGRKMNLNTVKLNNHYTLSEWTSDLITII